MTRDPPKIYSVILDVSLYCGTQTSFPRKQGGGPKPARPAPRTSSKGTFRFSFPSRSQERNTLEIP